MSKIARCRLIAVLTTGLLLLLGHAPLYGQGQQTQWCSTSFIDVLTPNQITVSGLSGSINNLTVTLNGLDSTGELQTLIVGPNGNNLEFFIATNADLNGNFTFADDAAPLSSNVDVTGGTFGPTSLFPEDELPFQPYEGPLSLAAPAGGQGAATFQTQFAGASPNGVWSLYTGSNPGDVYGSGWCINFNLSGSSANPTTTSVASTEATALSTDTVMLTATVSPNPGSGTVDFVDGNTILAAGVSLSENGTATYTIQPGSLGEGTHEVRATFNGNESYISSNGTLIQRIDNPTLATVNSPTFQYCNQGPIAYYTSVKPTAAGGFGTSTPYPSNIFVTNLPGVTQSMSVELNGLSASQNNASDLNGLNNMLVGPPGNLVFFSGVGGGLTVSNLNLTFSDGAGTVGITGPLEPGTYGPNAAGTVNFPACPSDVANCGTAGPNAPTANYVYAPPQGSGTFGALVGAGTDSNGTWSLFTQDTVEEASASIAGGWCLNFTQTLPAATLTQNGSASIQPGGQGQYTFTLTNDGPGPTGGPLTFTDVPSSGLTVTQIDSTDSNWTCSGSSCTYNANIAQGASAGPLSVTLSAASNVTTTQSNYATVAGQGIASTATSNTLNITTVSSTSTAAVNASATYSANAQSVLLTAQVTSAGGTVNGGTVTFTILGQGSTIGNPATSGTVTNGVASATFTLPGGTPTGTYTIVAAYSGAATFSMSSDSSHTLTVNAATPSISFLTASSYAYGQSFQAAANSNSTGTITYSLVSGPASVTASGLITIVGEGSVTVEASQAAAGNYGPGTMNAVFGAAKAGSSTMLNGSLVSSGNGFAASLTATVSPQYTGTPTGTVTFYDGQNALTTQPLVSGTATYTTPQLAGGPHSFSAAYTGDTNFTKSTSNTLPETVATSTVKLELLDTNLVYPLPPVVSVTVARSGPTQASGTVTLYDGGSALGTYPLNDGILILFELPPLKVGTHPLQAVYNGNANYPPGMSSVVTVTVTPGPVKLSLACESTSIEPGKSLSCTVSANEFSLAVSGTVNYTITGGSSGSVALNKHGQATITAKPEKSGTITVTYPAQGNYEAAEPASIKFTIK